MPAAVVLVPSPPPPARTATTWAERCGVRTCIISCSTLLRRRDSEVKRLAPYARAAPWTSDGAGDCGGTAMCGGGDGGSGGGGGGVATPRSAVGMSDVVGSSQESVSPSPTGMSSGSGTDAFARTGSAGAGGTVACPRTAEGGSGVAGGRGTSA